MLLKRARNVLGRFWRIRCRYEDQCRKENDHQLSLADCGKMRCLSETFSGYRLLLYCRQRIARRDARDRSSGEIKMNHSGQVAAEAASACVTNVRRDCRNQVSIKAAGAARYRRGIAAHSRI